LTARLAENARYQLHSASLGALSARSTVHVQLAGERSEVGLFNVSVGGKNQVHDTFALVEHIAANARTEQASRDLRPCACRIQWQDHRSQGRTWHRFATVAARIARGADAEIDVRPQSRSYRRCRCNHGATAGKLDDTCCSNLLSRDWIARRPTPAEVGIP